MQYQDVHSGRPTQSLYRSVSRAIALIVMSSVLLSACMPGGPKGEQEDEQEATPIPVETASLQRGDVSAVYAGTANFEAEQEAQVVAKVAGEVKRILVEEGDQVKAGQVLATLDGDRLRLQLERAKANLGKMQNDYDRNVEVHAKGLVTEESFDGLRFDLEALKADVKLATLELSYTQIRASIDGVVTARDIKIGSNIKVNDPVFQIVDLQPLLAYLHVPEREFNRLQAGQTAAVQVDALGEAQFQGVIARISPVVDAQTGTFKVTIEARDPQNRLKPGMFSRFSVAYDVHEQVVLVPRDAVLGEAPDATVFVVEDGLAKRRDIALGLTQGSNVEVTSGLDGDEQVVVIGQGGLRDGGKVHVVSTPPGDESTDQKIEDMGEEKALAASQ